MNYAGIFLGIIRIRNNATCSRMIYVFLRQNRITGTLNFLETLVQIHLLGLRAGIML